MTPDNHMPLPPGHPGREAERLRAILETLVTTQPHLALADAVPLVFRIEEHAARREREELERLHTQVQQTTKSIPTVIRSSCDVADWIDSHAPKAAGVRAHIMAGNLINAIKDVRAELGIGLKEAKDGVEWWRDYRMTSTPASGTAPF